MIGNRPKEFKNTKIGTSPEIVINFIEKHLQFFIPDTTEYENKDREVLLNFYLNNFFNSKVRENDLPFNFSTECPKKQSSHSEDICVLVINNNNPFLTIECKRLPSPQKIREKEYLHGKHGGIERFRLNKHGIDLYGRLIDINVMIGYVENLTFDFWLNEINNWINELSILEKDNLNWSKNDHLFKLKSNKIFKSESSHLRISNKYVNLIHFWIKIPTDET